MQNNKRLFFIKNHQINQTPPKAAAVTTSTSTSTTTTTTTTNPILTYLNWLLLILKSLGLIPFYTIVDFYEIAAPNRRCQRFNRFIIFVKLTLNFIHICALLSPAMLRMLFNRSKTDGISNMLDVIFCLLSDITISWSCVCQTTRLIQIINRLMKIDQQLDDFPKAPAYEQMYAAKNPFNIYMILVLCYISLIMVPFLKRTLNLFSLYYCIYLMIYQLENTVSCIFVIFISALLNLLAKRFQYINQMLMQYNSKCFPNNRYTHVPTNLHVMPIAWSHLPIQRALAENEVNLRQFVENSKLIYGLHNDLLHIFKMINCYAGLGLLAFLLYACYGLLSCIYTAFLFDWKAEENFFYIIWTLSWIPLYACILIVLTTNCDIVTKEANKTSKVLSRIYGSERENQNVIDKFLLKSIKQDVQFTAYGFFVIDNTTLFNVFSAVTTYLVILIQFKQLEGSKGKV